MPSPNISFAKIVATPTASAWSQAYNAGSLFLAISLTSDAEDLILTEEGKKLLHSLETEIFILEEKNLATIQSVITETLINLPPTVIISLSLVYIKDDLLYCFLQGEGALTLKRGDKRLNILSGEKNPALQTASGYLKTDDLLFLQTSQFVSIINEKTLKEAFEYPLPNDIAETITPLIHNQNEGGASAIVLAFKGVPKSFMADDPSTESESNDLTLSGDNQSETPGVRPFSSEAKQHKKSSLPAFLFTSLKGIPFFTKLKTLPRQKKIILTFTLFLVLLLIGSIIFTKNLQQKAVAEKLFQKTYPEALKEYENGRSLVSLNQSFANDSFLKAKQLLSTLDNHFSPESKEGKQIVSLQEKIDQELKDKTKTQIVPKKIKFEDAPALNFLLNTKGALSVTEDENDIYLLTSETIEKINKKTDKREALIKNKQTWTKTAVIAVYGANIYVLDEKEGLLKFIPTNDGYEKTAYFNSPPANLAETVSFTIDGSVYLLYRNGLIEKYTKGQKDRFELSSLDSPLNQPIAILTTIDEESLYILDPRNKKVVQVSKTGTFEKEYSSDLLKTATAFSLSPSGNEITFLSDGNFYSLSLD